MKTKIILILIIGLTKLSLPLSNWEVLKTDNFIGFYPPGYQWEIKEALSVLEEYREDVVKLTGNNALTNVPITLEDLGGLPNGFANPITQDIHLFTSPPQPNILGPVKNWYRLLAVHEYTHLAHLTHVSGLAKVLTQIFGTPFQPNIYSPGWLIEGLAVLSESQASPYEGRLNDSFFSEVVKTKLREKKFPSLYEITFPVVEFPGGATPYLYGGVFMKYLAEEYGQERFKEFFTLMGSSFLRASFGLLFPAVGIDYAARRVYGKTFPELFKAWQKKMKQEKLLEEKEIEEIHAPGWYITRSLLFQNKIYYIHARAESSGPFAEWGFNEIRELNLKTRSDKVLISTTSFFIDSLKGCDNKLYYGIGELKKGFPNITFGSFGFSVKLYQYELSKQQTRLLLWDELRAFEVLTPSQIIYSKDRAHCFGSELWLWEEGKKKKVGEFPFLIGEIVKITPSQLAFLARENYQNWDIYLFNLKTKKYSPLIITPESESSLSYYQKHLFFISTSSSKQWVYAYHPETNQLYKITSQGYLASPIFHNDYLYFIGLNSEGNTLSRKKITHWQKVALRRVFSSPHSPPRVEFKKGGLPEHLWSLLPKIRLPYLEVTGEEEEETKITSWGVFLFGEQATGEHSYSLKCGYDVIKRKPLLNLSVLSRLFLPSIFHFEYKSEESFGTTWSYPLVTKLTEGLSFVILSASGELKSSFKRTGFSLALPFGFTYPKIFLAFFPACYFNFRLPSLNLEEPPPAKLKIIGFHYIDKSALRLEITFNSKKAPEYSLSCPFLIHKINVGLWNPCIFFRSLYFNPFFSLKPKLSLGVEFIYEFCFTPLGMFGIPLRVGVMISEGENLKWYFKIGEGD
jgi:hypothetical protein